MRRRKTTAERLFEKQALDKLTPELFIRSRPATRYFTDTASALSERFGGDAITVRVVDSVGPGGTACTDGDHISLAPTSMPGYEPKSISDLFVFTEGLLFHELGHVLYTDFAEGKNHEDDYVDLIKGFPKLAKAPWVPARELFSTFNVLEDGFVELSMCKNFPGSPRASITYKRKLESSLNRDFEEMAERSLYIAFMATTLMYSTTGTIKTNGGKKHEKHIKLFNEKIKPLIDDFLKESSSAKRWDICLEVFKILLPFLEEETPDDISDEVGEDSSGEGTSGGSPLDGGSDGKDSKDSDSDGDDGDSEDEKGKEDEDDDDSKSSGGKSKGSSKKLSEEDIRKLREAFEEFFKKLSKKEPLIKDPSSSTEGLGSRASEISSAEADESAGSDLKQKVIEDIAEILSDEAEKGLKKDLCKSSMEDEKEAKGKLVVEPLSCPDSIIWAEDTLSEIDKECHIIGKSCASKIRAKLSDKSRGGRLGSLMDGDKMDVRKAYLEDGKVFSRKINLTEPPKFALSLVVDESGSMGGRKIEAARKAALILYNMCRELDIPCQIVGHDASFSSTKVNIREYTKFTPSKNDKLRICTIDSRCDNHDGLAYRYALKSLLRRREDQLLLFTISDGAPEHSGCGYRMRNGSKDINDVMNEAKKKKVMFKAIAIDDLERLTSIYGKNIIDATDINRFPTILAKELKRAINI